MPPPADKYKTTKTNIMDGGLAELKIDNAKTKSQNTFASDLEDSTNNGVRAFLRYNIALFSSHQYSWQTRKAKKRRTRTILHR